MAAERRSRVPAWPWPPGSWQIADQALCIRPFTPLHPLDRDALLAEAVQLCGFAAPRAARNIVLDEPEKS
jgi:hypothetical protein